MDQKILLIDDSVILRRIATNVLCARAGCDEVITATRATEGFARACTSGVRLILVDYQIAGHPDATLCRRLFDEPRTSEIPVILLLGKGMTPPASGVLPPNVVNFLVKPFTPEQLVSAVEGVFESTRVAPPIRKLREQSAAPYSVRTPTLTDQREVAAVSAAAVARRETNRVHTARAVAHAKARVTTVVRDGLTPLLPSEPLRLRAAMNDAAARKQTGVFQVRAGATPATELYFDNGQVVILATHDARRYSEDADGVVPPKVSPTLLDDAVAEQAQTGIPFFLTLGARGLLSKTTAVTLLHRFGQQHFARLWTIPTASLTFEFTELDALPGFALRLDARRESVDEWLLGTLRHLQAKDVAVIARHEGLTGSVSFRRNGAEALRVLDLCEQEHEFVRQVEGRRDLPAIARALGVTPEHAFLLLFRFRCLEMMDYRPTASAFVVTPRTSVRRVLPLQR